MIAKLGRTRSGPLAPNDKARAAKSEPMDSHKQITDLATRAGRGALEQHVGYFTPKRAASMPLYSVPATIDLFRAPRAWQQLSDDWRIADTQRR